MSLESKLAMPWGSVINTELYLARVTWESHVLLNDGQAICPMFSGFHPPLMNNRLDISEIFFKGP